MTKLSAIRIPGIQVKLPQGHRAGDSLGNPSSPGYESFRKSPKLEDKDEEKRPALDGKLIVVPSEGPGLIRLRSGWEALLFVQKTICEKTKQLFTAAEAPLRYEEGRRLKACSLKSCGCIVDIDNA